MDQSDWRCAVSEAGVEPEDTDPAALVENEQAVWRLGRGDVDCNRPRDDERTPLWVATETGYEGVAAFASGQARLWKACRYLQSGQMGPESRT